MTDAGRLVDDESAVARALHSWHRGALRDRFAYEDRVPLDEACEACDSDPFLSSADPRGAWPHWMRHGLRERIHAVRDAVLRGALTRSAGDATIGDLYRGSGNVIASAQSPQVRDAVAHVDTRRRAIDRLLVERIRTLGPLPDAVLRAGGGRGAEPGTREAVLFALHRAIWFEAIEELTELRDRFDGDRFDRDPVHAAACELAIARAHLARYRASLACHALERLLARCEAHEDDIRMQRMRARAETLLFDARRRQHELVGARAAALDAIASWERLGCGAAAATVRRRLGRHEREHGRLAVAELLLTQARDGARRHGRPANEASAELQLAVCLRLAGRHLEAVAHYEAARSWLRRSRGIDGDALVDLNVHSCLRAAGDDLAARDVWRRISHRFSDAQFRDNYTGADTRHEYPLPEYGDAPQARRAPGAAWRADAGARPRVALDAADIRAAVEPWRTPTGARPPGARADAERGVLTLYETMGLPRPAILWGRSPQACVRMAFTLHAAVASLRSEPDGIPDLVVELALDDVWMPAAERADVCRAAAALAGEPDPWAPLGDSLADLADDTELLLRRKVQPASLRRLERTLMPALGIRMRAALTADAVAIREGGRRTWLPSTWHADEAAGRLSALRRASASVPGCEEAAAWDPMSLIEENSFDLRLWRRVVILCEAPATISFDDEGALHGTGPAAAVWPDGWAIFAWHGTPIPADLVRGELSAARILAEPNLEVRRSAIEMIGWPRFIETAADSSVGTPAADPANPGQILSLHDVPSSTLGTAGRVLLCTNASLERDGTRRRYGLLVPPTISDPLEAAAWTFGLARDDYLSLQAAS